MTHWFGNSLKMQEIGPITQWKKLNVKINFFFENLDANKSDPRKTGQLINELKSRKSKSTKVPQVKTGNQVLIQLTLVLISLKHLTIILQLNIGQCLAQENPSLEIDPLAHVNPVDGVFSFQWTNVTKVTNRCR